MQIKEEKQGNVLFVTIDQHLDSMAAPALEHRLVSLLDAGERRLVIDCAPLDYVNSAGLKVFLLAAKKLEGLGGHLVVCSLPSSVLMIFEMIGFTRIMKIVPSREDAIRILDGYTSEA